MLVTALSPTPAGEGKTTTSINLVASLAAAKRRVLLVDLDPQVTDEGIFPYLDYDLSAMPGSFRSVDNKKQQIAIEQKINDDFYISASFLREDDLRRQVFAPIAQQQAEALAVLDGR